MRINAPLSSDSSSSTCNSTGRTGQRAERLGQLRALGVFDRRRRPHAGDAPAPGLCGQLHQEVQGADDVPGPAAGHGVARQRKGGGGHLALQQLGDEALARLDVEVAIGQRGAQGRCGAHDPGEAEQVVLQRLQLGGGHVLVHGRGEATDPLAGLGQAQSRLLVLPLAEVAHAGADPAERGGHLGCADHHAGEGRQPARLGRDLPVQQVEHDSPAGQPVHGGVGQCGPELVVGQHELLDRFKVGRQPTERGRAGRLGHCGRVPLKRRVH